MKTLDLSFEEFKMVVNNIDNIESRKHIEAKNMFERLKANREIYFIFKVDKRETNYLIMINEKIIDIFISLGTINTILSLNHNKIKKQKMFTALGININKKIPSFTYVKVHFN
jgi:hypothetical protein